MEKEKGNNRGEINEAFHDNKWEKTIVHKNIERPILFKFEFRLAPGKIRSRPRWDCNRDADRMRQFGNQEG